MGKLTEHVRTRLSALDRDEPAGPLASWRWLWRAVRATGTSLPMAALRFSWLVVHDLVLLGVWAMARPFRRSRAVRGVTAMAAVAIVALVATTDGGPEPESHDLHPGLELQDGMVHADIEFGEPAAEGWFRFGGQMIRRDMLPAVIESHGVESVRLRVESDNERYFTFMFDMMGELRDLGVRRVGFGPPPDPRAAGLPGGVWSDDEGTYALVSLDEAERTRVIVELGGVPISPEKLVRQFRRLGVDHVYLGTSPGVRWSSFEEFSGRLRDSGIRRSTMLLVPERTESGALPRGVWVEDGRRNMMLELDLDGGEGVIRMARVLVPRAKLLELIERHTIEAVTISIGGAYADREFIGAIFSDLEAAGVRHVTLTDKYDDGFTPDDVDAGWTFDVEWFPADRRVSADGRPPVFRLPANMFRS